MEDAVWFLLAVQVILNLFLVGNIVSIRKLLKDWLNSSPNKAIIDILGACEMYTRVTAIQAEEIKKYTEGICRKTETVYNLDSIHLELQSINRWVSSIQLDGSVGFSSTLDRIEDNLINIKRALEK